MLRSHRCHQRQVVYADVAATSATTWCCVSRVLVTSSRSVTRAALHTLQSPSVQHCRLLQLAPKLLTRSASFRQAGSYSRTASRLYQLRILMVSCKRLCTSTPIRKLTCSWLPCAVKGVTIYISDFHRSLPDKLNKDFFNEPSQV